MTIPDGLTVPPRRAPQGRDRRDVEAGPRWRRDLALGFLRRSGVFSLIASSSWRRRRLCILMFHGVSIADEHLWDPDLYLSVERYRAALQTIRDTRCRVLPLDEAVERLHAGSLPPRAVSLTFDDGNYDFVSRAVPLLQEFDYPATAFVATYYSEFAKPVFNTTLGYTLWKAQGRSADPSGIAEGAEPLATETGTERRRSWRRIFDFALNDGMTGLEKHELLVEVADRFRVDLEAVLDRRMFQLMRPDELAALPRDIVDVQLHTHRHRTPRDRDAFSREIVENRESLRRALGGGHRLDQFCYPSGDYVPDYVPWLRELGVRIGVTCDNGLATADTSEVLLPRFAVTSSMSDSFLQALLIGLPDLLGRSARLNNRDEEVSADTAGPDPVVSSPRAG